MWLELVTSPDIQRTENSMMDLIKILYILSLLGFLYYLTIRVFIKKDPFGKKEWIITLLLLGVTLTLYVRLIVHDLLIVEPSDEALYVSLIRELSNGGNPPISGPGYRVGHLKISPHYLVSVSVRSSFWSCILSTKITWNPEKKQ